MLTGDVGHTPCESACLVGCENPLEVTSGRRLLEVVGKAQGLITKLNRTLVICEPLGAVTVKLSHYPAMIR